ncbi:HEPN domain-containing protein [Orrella marina]|uniref:RiboL-PSP-HEPN domain-containing protein n=1 Tax=Orrella marina TaxID=2163011 RepID=A0A2R4XF23_9BURK|nr:HEPN domain-containing protein [Orrella marina]AWB32395.1 hypothetical protein DBV39_00230 [Orrella marina]
MQRHASLKDALDATFARASRIDTGENELRADFARHLCVLVSGFIDQTIKNYTIEYVRKRSSVTVTNHVSKAVTNLTNLKAEKLISHLLSFDPNWKPKLEVLIADERKAAVDSVITLRHGIAHGKPGDVTIARISNYYAEVGKVMSGIRVLMQIDD